MSMHPDTRDSLAIVGAIPIVFALVILGIAAAGGFVDRGLCLASHPVAWWQADYMTTCDAKGFCTQQPIGGHVVETTDCVRWEFPNGRPEAKKGA
jgi:hypothetical protein